MEMRDDRLKKILSGPGNNDVPIIGQKPAGVVDRKDYPKPPEHIMKMINESQMGKDLLAKNLKDRDILVEVCITCGSVSNPTSGDMLGEKPVIRAGDGQTCPLCANIIRGMGPHNFLHLMHIIEFTVSRMTGK